VLFLVDRCMVKSLWRSKTFGCGGIFYRRTNGWPLAVVLNSTRTIGEKTGANIGRNSKGIWWHHVKMCNLCRW
jgi:hypothetical protein